jgi:hypothetical protein
MFLPISQKANYKISTTKDGKEKKKKKQGNVHNIKNLISTVTPDIMRLGKKHIHSH